MMKTLFALLVTLIVSFSAFGQRHIRISSPDNAITFSFRLTKTAPVYSVSYRGNELISDSELGLSFLEAGSFKNNLELLRPLFRDGEEKYELIVGKTSAVASA